VRPSPRRRWRTPGRPRRRAAAADRAAKTITAGIETGKAEIVFPLQMAVLMKTARLVPIRLWSLLAQPRGDRAPS